MTKRVVRQVANLDQPGVEPAENGIVRAPRTTARGRTKRTLDAIPDTIDFRDQMFVPTLVEVPMSRPLDIYRRARVPILDQQGEGACTGFGLATVANYLLHTRKVIPDTARVSPRMLYEMAKRYDEWPGTDYEGSSARGAMKGWHKHGVCCDSEWPYDFGKRDLALTASRASDAVRRPLGAYFRVNHQDLVAMHSAIAESGVLYATSTVHEGWQRVKKNGIIPFDGDSIGGHAFAIVGYDVDGFWIQNSWGSDWGHDGFCRVSYDDWLANGTDVWVARLGAPVRLGARHETAQSLRASSAGSRGYVFQDLRPHVVSIGNDGALRTSGTYGTSRADVERMITDDLPRLTKSWSTDRPKRIVLYAHGGLVPEDSALQRIAEYRAALLDAEVYPIGFVWRTDFWTTIGNVLRDALRSRRPEGFLDKTKDFMLDRLDDMLEPVARAATGRLAWQEMKENALRAATVAPGGAVGGAAIVADLLAALDASERRAGRPGIEIHIVAHSAGSILFAPLVPRLTNELGLIIETLTLWAPACTMALFDTLYRPAIEARRVRRFALYTLTDRAEQDDDCAGIYHKSLLYLVAHAFEDVPRLPFTDGTPILGMERFIRKHPALMALFDAPVRGARREWIRSPNESAAGALDAASAHQHGDFDDDVAVVRGTLARITGASVDVEMTRTAAGRRALRRGLG